MRKGQRKKPKTSGGNVEIIRQDIWRDTKWGKTCVIVTRSIYCYSDNKSIRKRIFVIVENSSMCKYNGSISYKR